MKYGQWGREVLSPKNIADVIYGWSLFMILSLKSTPVLIGWLAVWMFGVTMATVRTILMLWGAIDDSKVDEEFDWTMPVIGSVIYIVFGGTNAVQFYTGTATNYLGPTLKTQHNLDGTFRESYRKD